MINCRFQGRVVEGASVLEAYSWKAKSLSSKNSADLATAFLCTNNGEYNTMRPLYNYPHSVCVPPTHTKASCTTYRREGSVWNGPGSRASLSSSGCTTVIRY